MLTHEIMGWVALWILWGNTLLVAVAAWKASSSLARRARQLEGHTVLRARILAAHGDRFAAFVVDQVGRYGAGSTRRILWQDRACRSTLEGGVIEIEGSRIEVAPREDAEVWIGADEVDAASSCPSRGAFEEAYPTAKKVRGVERAFSVELGSGRDVFVSGRVVEEGGTLHLEPPSSGPLLVSAMDPLAWLSRRVGFARYVFIPGIIAGAGACTALALVPPIFDSLPSKAGGLLGFVFFLLVLPAGTSLRDFLREPSRRIVRGAWEEPAQALLLRAANAPATAKAKSAPEPEPAPRLESDVPAPRTVQAPPSG